MSSEGVACTADVIKSFVNVTKNPESYLSVQGETALHIRRLVKSIYDFTKNSEDATVKVDSLRELIIRDFDEEQIWQQLELQNEGRWNRFLSDVSKHVAQKDRLVFPLYLNKEQEITVGDESPQCEDLNDSIAFNEENDDVEEGPSQSEEDEPQKKITKPSPGKSSIVDDKFFKLRDMQQFLDLEDRKVLQGSAMALQDSGDEGSEDSIDLFEDLDSEDLSDDDDQNKEDDDDEDDKRNPKYSEFFDDPVGEESSKKKNMLKTRKDELNNKSDSDFVENSDLDFEDADEKKRVRFRTSHDNDDGEQLPEKSTAETFVRDTGKPDIQSTFEIRQERLTKKIGHLERAALGEKPWQLKGEVDAKGRPQNSLLEEVVEFDLTARPAPVITEETTLRLEDIVRQRIKDKAWDDVQRKVKPVDTPIEFKKKLVLDQEKSKASLVQVYEQEYLKQKDSLEHDTNEKPEEESKVHKEIKSMMTSLFAKLDALSNFHYTPKAAAPEVRIVSNIPAISMEEVAPVATSDAALLAPEEIKGKPKGDIIGKGERSDVDKNRERRQKKIKQRVREKEREQKAKVLEKLHPGLGNKYSKEKAAKLLDKVSKDRNVEQMQVSGEGKSIRSSTAFFTQLQEAVTSQIKNKTQMPKKKKKETLTAKQIKL